MLFMICCLLVMAAACAEMFKTLSAQISYLSDRSAPKPSIVTPLLAMAMMLAFTSPLLFSVYGALDQSAAVTDADGVRNVRRTVYLVFVGSGLVAAYAYLLFSRTPSNIKGEFWPVGRSVVLAGVVMVGSISSISHLTFFRSSNDGIANIELLRRMAPLKDMANCTSGVAFVQYREDDGPLTYRCPTLLVFGGETSQPFAPYPDYVDGKSEELATVLKETLESATKLEAPE
ncbi:hypothetical protein F2S72_01365 [Pseudomonas syringae pv. actinidiae]|nr:hypothetical protein [Pseudomonas syringae pv. actinidiae]